MDIAKIIADLNEIQWEIDLPYRNFTTFGVGKTAPLVARAKSDLELTQLVRYLNNYQIPFQVITGGSNLVGMDDNFDGVIILLNQGDFRKISLCGNLIVAGAGVKIIELAQFALKNGFGGLASLVGIPGGVGGSLIMNAGAGGNSIGKYVFQVVGIRANGENFYRNGNEIEYGCPSHSAFSAL